MVVSSGRRRSYVPLAEAITNIKTDLQTVSWYEQLVTLGFHLRGERIRVSQTALRKGGASGVDL